MDALSNVKFYLLRRSGPLLFKLRSGESESIYTISIASPSHRCTCGGGEAKGYLCCHIIFVIIKILKVPKSNHLAWQLSWRPEEVDRVLSGNLEEGDCEQNKLFRNFLKKGDGFSRQAKARNKEHEAASGDTGQNGVDETLVAQRELGTDSTCAICYFDMTVEELNEKKLCYCVRSCGSNFHLSCMKIYIGHSRMEKKGMILCPLCRAPWETSLAASVKNNDDDDKACARPKLPPLHCNRCRLTIRKEFARCAHCPSVNLCKSCFNGGAISSHDPNHIWFMADSQSNPTKWKAICPPLHRSTRLRQEREHLSLLQHRELTPADYHELLLLDNSHSYAPPLHEHSVNAIREVPTSDSGQRCDFCSISLAVDRTAKQFPCQHIVHRTCAMNILLSALSNCDYEGEGAPLGALVCPICPSLTVDDEKSTNLLFPSLREPEEQNESIIRPSKEKSVSKSKPTPPCDVTNLSIAHGKSTKGDNVSIMPCLSITGVCQSSTIVAIRSANSQFGVDGGNQAMILRAKNNFDRRTRSRQETTLGMEKSDTSLMLAVSNTNCKERLEPQRPRIEKKNVNIKVHQRGIQTKSVIDNKRDMNSNLSDILQIGRSNVRKSIRP